MNVIRAKVLGFCFGVRRAVELAEQALESSRSLSLSKGDGKVYSLQFTNRIALYCFIVSVK